MKKLKENKYFIIVNLVLIIVILFNTLSINKINNKLDYIEKNYQLSSPTNSPKRLLVPGVYNDNQSYHPKVINFNKKWNGYKYWISYTPYPNADSSKENPHIKASNDLINWIEPKNGVNPLDEVANPDNNTRYNSDSHLVYNDDTKELECWWRYVDDAKKEVTIYRRKSSNGYNWTNKEVVLNAKREKEDWISPAIIYEDSTYKIWYVFNNNIYYIESKDLKNFSEPQKLNINYEESVLSWHLDVTHTKNGYEMLIVAYTDWDHRALMNLYYTKSDDNKNYDTAQVILKPTTNTNNWDNSGLYRSSLIYENDMYYVFYSGQGTNNAKGIGLMYGKNIFELKPFRY